MSSRCTCKKHDLGDGVLRREWPASDCPTHGFPNDQWYAGDPLRKHMRVIDKATGEAVHPHEARARLAALDPDGIVYCDTWGRTYRDEKPSETLDRLMAERRPRPFPTNATPPVKVER